MSIIYTLIMDTIRQRNILKETLTLLRTGSENNPKTFLSNHRPSMIISKKIRLINDLYMKRRQVSLFMNLIGVLLIIFSLLYLDIKMSYTESSILLNITLAFCTFLTLLYVMSKHLKSLHSHLIHVKSDFSSSDHENLPKIDVIWSLLFLIHPNLILDGITLRLTWVNPEQVFRQELNTFLMAIQITLLFLDISQELIANSRAFSKISNYLIIQQNGRLNKIIFTVKYLLFKKPANILLRCIVLVGLYFSIMLRIFESPIDLIDDSCLRTWNEVLWNSFFAIMTCGYGDCTPITYLGRAVSSITGVFGTVIFSLFVISTNNFVKFEEKDVDIFKGLKARAVNRAICVEASRVIVKVSRAYLYYKKRDYDNYQWAFMELENSILKFRRVKRRLDKDRLLRKIQQQ